MRYYRVFCISFNSFVCNPQSTNQIHEKKCIKHFLVNNVQQKKSNSQNDCAKKYIKLDCFVIYVKFRNNVQFFSNSRNIAIIGFTIVTSSIEITKKSRNTVFR